MQVVQLHDRRNQEIVAEIEALLRLAKKGRLQGFLCSAKFGPNDHRYSAAGCYRRNPGEALTATILIERHLADTIPPAPGEEEAQESML